MKIMKHGNERQKECQRKKKWKSIINLKPLLMAMLIMTMVTVIIFMVMRNRNNYEDSKFILEQQRFIVVDDSDDKNLYRSYFENGYDLRSNNSYSKTQVVVKNGKKYGSYSDEKPSDRYHRDLYRNITSAILNLKVSKVEIENQTLLLSEIRNR